MAERLTGPEGKANKSEHQAELEAVRRRPERATETEPDNSRERQQKARETISKSAERLKPKQTAEDKKDHSEKEKPTHKFTKREKRAAFKKEISKVQAQLPPATRTLSRVVHNRLVENVSEVLEETVLRPSVLLGGAVVGLLAGGMFYVYARIQGFPLSGSEFLISMLAGGLIGVVLEIIYKWFKHS